MKSQGINCGHKFLSQAKSYQTCAKMSFVNVVLFIRGASPAYLRCLMTLSPCTQQHLCSGLLKSFIFRPVRGLTEEVVQSVKNWWCSSPFVAVLNSAAIVLNVLIRTQDESLMMMMMIMTINPVSAGRLQCFLSYLLFDALQSHFCANSSSALQRFSKRLCFNDVTDCWKVKWPELGRF